jgi:ATP-dependent RNA helicase DeaD
MTTLPPDFAELLGPAFAGALAKKGYESLTPVQKAVLDPELAGRDLRITSQTGSGKTVAIGLALREQVAAAPRRPGVAKPVAIVVAPTRELAKQVEQELAWLYAPLNVHIASATGGAAYGDERRALSKGPAIIVGTPGRLLDHLERKVIDASEVAAIVLDEADRMLDLGFREELEAILGHAPKGHRTHLTSATFPRGVKSLADRIQTDPAHVQGTPLGAANADIDHVVHLVDPRERVNAIINLLLAHPDEQTLVFCRTRADVASFARELRDAGFGVSSISGEMEQPARNRALADFKTGKLRALIATDVAARGIDVQDIARVIHADPPNDADTYTHRSGRTGRAGRKGTSSVMVAPSALSRTSMVLQRARVVFRIEPIPTGEQIFEQREHAMFEELTRSADEEFPPRVWSFAERLSASDNVTQVVARLLARAEITGPTAPRPVRPIASPADRPRAALASGRTTGPEARSTGGQRERAAGSWVPFRVSIGEEQGADARRLLPIVCRRGDIRGNQVGSIRVARKYAVVEIAAEVADAFEAAAQQPDPRDPRVLITRDHAAREPAPREHAPRERPAREHAPREHAPRQHAPREHAPREHAPREHAPREHAPREHAPREHAPRERPAREVRPRDARPDRARPAAAPVKPAQAERSAPARQDEAPIERIVRKIALEEPAFAPKRETRAARPADAHGARAPHDRAKPSFARSADDRPRGRTSDQRPPRDAGRGSPPMRRDRPAAGDRPAPVSGGGARFAPEARKRTPSPAKASDRLDLAAKPPKRRIVVTADPNPKRGPKRKPRP